MPTPRLPEDGLPRLLTAAEARAGGLDRGAVAHRVRTGAWLAVGAGRYLRTDPGSEGPSGNPGHAVLIARAAAHAADGLAVVSHGSAALVHGLPLITRERDAHVTAGRRQGSTAGARRHLGAVPDGDRVRAIVGGVPVAVTAPLRTWLDIARTMSLADALAAGDHAVRAGLMTVAQARHASAALPPGARGRRAAILAAAHLDPHRESPLESWSWARFVEWRLPLPSCQSVVFDDDGTFLARTDFEWEARRIVGEVDGAVKYRERSDLYAEKRREDAIRSTGRRVVRWGAGDLRQGTVLRARLLSLLS